MKKIVVVGLAVLGLSTLNIFGTPLLTDNFDSYSAGNLVGQGGWAQTSTSATTPIQVNGGVVSIGSSGQDVYDPLSSPVTLSDGQSLYISLNINVSAAQATGDYFLHFAPTVGETSIFENRLELKSTAGGYLLGWLGTAGGGGTVAYGTSVLSLNTSYQVVLAYNYFSATTTSATGAIYVNPTDPAVGNNTAYGTFAWSGTNPDIATIAEINLRQGSASAAPTLKVDNLVVSELFSDVVSVPEPSSAVLAAFGGLICLFSLHRRQ
jgi:trimeric autotransporter adhesin